MSPESIIIRNYAEGDEEGIVTLFGQVFGQPRSVDYWRWQFSDKEMGTGWVSVAEINGELVGQDSLIRKRLSFLGRDFIVAQSCDSMVRTDEQGKGIFPRVVAYNYRGAANDGAVAVFGFMSLKSRRGSYPVFMRQLDWTRITNLKHYLLRMGGRRLWGQSVDNLFKLSCYLLWDLKCRVQAFLLQKDFKVEVSARIPEDLEETLRRIRDYEVLSIWKDVSYLRWRYENHPEHRYTFHILRSHGTPLGLAVTRTIKQQNTLAICELLHREKSVRDSKLLLLHLMKYYIRSSNQSIQFYGYDSGFYDTAFASAGFKVEGFSSVIFGGRVFENPKLQNFFVLPHNWSVSWGDMDTI